ncbi:MAG: antitoxin VapB family protein [archaeon]|nr:antitoxin VapB family protein [archaeon]MCP8321693.1 antitoxin VapB family protein [archaeon]
MGYKTISLSDEAYEKLATLKKKGESFSDVIIRLYSKTPKRPLSSFAGAWSMSDEEEEKIFGELSGMWKRYEESLLGHRLSSRIAKKKARSQ